MSATQPRGTLAWIEAITGPLSDQQILDIGCGRGKLARALTARGARVTALDPDPDAVAATRAAAPAAKATTGVAERLPFPAERFDAAIFLNSLHHLPESAMVQGLEEALRVVRPGGPLIVVEPLAEGSCFQAMRVLEDETQVRAAAQAAIETLVARGGLAIDPDVTFERREIYASAEAFIDTLVAVDRRRKETAQIRRREILDALERHAERLDGPEESGFLLIQPLRLQAIRAKVA